MMNKKGVSALIATVLLVLITIAAVGIIWGAVMPMIKGNIEKSTKCYDAILEIKQGGNTCYNMGGILDVQIARGEKSVNISNIQIQISCEGTSKAVKATDAAVDVVNRGFIPGPNEEVKYSIDITALNLACADSVSAAPIVMIGKTESLCSATTSVAINSC